MLLSVRIFANKLWGVVSPTFPVLRSLHHGFAPLPAVQEDELHRSTEVVRPEVRQAEVEKVNLMLVPQLRDKIMPAINFYCPPSE